MPASSLQGVFKSIAAGDGAAVVESWIESGGHVDARLIEDGKDAGTLLAACVTCGRGSVVDLLLRRGANVDVQNEIGWNALMSAAFEGNVALVRRLLEWRARTDLQNHNGNTALSIARQRRHIDIVRLLYESGAGATEEPATTLAGLAQLFPQDTAVVRFPS